MLTNEPTKGVSNLATTNVYKWTQIPNLQSHIEWIG